MGVSKMESPVLKKRYLTYDSLPIVNIKTVLDLSSGDEETNGQEKKKKGKWKKRYLNFTRDYFAGNGEVFHGRTVNDVPNKKIKVISREYVSSLCAPTNCFSYVHKSINYKTANKKEDVSQMTIVDGIHRWDEHKDFAYGMAVSLYESDNERFIGDPMADSLAVVTRENCGLLALADGVSWGQKSKLASNCAIYGSITYLCKHIDNCINTKDVFRCILRAFENAQKCIVEQEATMTTLCVGVVMQLQEKDRWGLCVVNVGDSYAYIYNKKYGVKEVTHGSHSINKLRDMRFSGGALGPADGYNPDLGNLTCSFVILEEGDLVYLCSDGISDNFDPAVAKFTPKFKFGEKVGSEGKNISSSNSVKVDCDVTDTAETNYEQYTRILSQAKSLDENSEANDKQCTTVLCDPRPLQKTSEASNKPCSAVVSDPRPLDETSATNNKQCSTVLNNVKTLNDTCDGSTEMNNFNLGHRSSIKSMFDKFALPSDSIPINSMQIPIKTTCKTPPIDDNDASVKLPNFTVSIDENDISNQKNTLPGNKDVNNDGNNLKFNVCQNVNNSKTNVSVHYNDGKRSTISDIVGSVYFSNSNNSGNQCMLRSSQSEDNIIQLSHELEKESSVEKSNSYSSIEQVNSCVSISVEHVGSESTYADEYDANVTLTPRERHKGSLEQMTEMIRTVECESDRSSGVTALDVCAQILNFVVNRTAEKREILERVPQSQLNKLTSKERKAHNESVKKQLEGVPGKLDHASIVAYLVGIHGKELVKFQSQKSIEPFYHVDKKDLQKLTEDQKTEEQEIEELIVPYPAHENAGAIKQDYAL